MSIEVMQTKSNRQSKLVYLSLLFISVFVLGCGGQSLRVIDSEGKEALECRATLYREKPVIILDESEALIESERSSFSIQVLLNNGSPATIGDISFDERSLQLLDVETSHVRFKATSSGNQLVSFEVGEPTSEKKQYCSLSFGVESIRPRLSLKLEVDVVQSGQTTNLYAQREEFDSCVLRVVDPITTTITEPLLSSEDKLETFEHLNSTSAPSFVRYEVNCELGEWKTSKSVELTILPLSEVQLSLNLLPGGPSVDFLLLDYENEYVVSWNNPSYSVCELTKNGILVVDGPVSSKVPFSASDGKAKIHLRCFNDANQSKEAHVVVDVKAPTVLLKLNGKEEDFLLQPGQSVSIEWECTQVSVSGCLLKGAGIERNEMSGKIELRYTDIPEFSEIELIASRANETTQVRYSLKRANRMFFAGYTAQGEFDVPVEQVFTSESLAGLNLRKTPFKLVVDVRILSRINYQGVQSYSPSSVNFRIEEGSATLDPLTPHHAEKLNQCGSSPHEIFEGFRIDETSFHKIRNWINLDDAESKQYIFQFHDRQRFAVLSQSCYPSVLSGRSTKTGRLEQGPSLFGFPWDADGYSNTYGSAAYLYVDEQGTLRLQYKSQSSLSRVVFLVGILLQD